MGLIANKWRAWSVTHLYLGVALAFVYYCPLITYGSFDFFHDAPRDIVSGAVFNSMLSHLLQGDFLRSIPMQSARKQHAGQGASQGRFRHFQAWNISIVSDFRRRSVSVS
jgi:hypothetical protein